ncbi:hypothetical protein V8G54_007582, partial [Vigna mungo]
NFTVCRRDHRRQPPQLLSSSFFAFEGGSRLSPCDAAAVLAGDASSPAPPTSFSFTNGKTLSYFRHLNEKRNPIPNIASPDIHTLATHPLFFLIIFYCDGFFWFCDYIMPKWVGFV